MFLCLLVWINSSKNRLLRKTKQNWFLFKPLESVFMFVSEEYEEEEEEEEEYEEKTNPDE